MMMRIKRNFLNCVITFLIIVGSVDAHCDQSPVILDLPDYNTWCKGITISQDDAEDEKKQLAGTTTAVSAMDKELLKAKIETSGIPFLSNTKQISEDNKDGKTVRSISMDVCYIVSPSTPNPDDKSIKTSNVSGERVAALVCSEKAEGLCIDRLQIALAKKMANVPLETIKNWQWRYVRTTEIPTESSSFASALTAYDARPILGDAKIYVYGDIERPDPKKMRTLDKSNHGNFVIIPVEQGQWYISSVSLPK